MTDYENVGALAYDRDGPTGLTDIASYITLGRPSWFARGACLDHPEVSWFPERGEPAKPAKDICATCPVRIACANHALRNGEKFGVWGGLSERQRGLLRRSTWLTGDTGHTNQPSQRKGARKNRGRSRRDPDAWTGNEHAILNALADFDNGATNAELIDASGLAPPTYHSARPGLEMRGLIARDRQGRGALYALTEKESCETTLHLVSAAICVSDNEPTNESI